MKRKLLSMVTFVTSASLAFGQIYSLPYTQNFDTFPTDDVDFAPGAEPNTLVMDWINVQTDDAQDWYGRTVGTGSSNTGPTSDHTSGTGTYMFVEDGWGNNTNIALRSPGFDLTSTVNSVSLSYWVHSQTNAAGNALMVEASNDEVSWTMVDSLGVLSATDTWFERLVDLTPFIGDTVYLRWVGTNNVTSFSHDIGIDDVFIQENVFQALVSSHVDVICGGEGTGSLSVSSSFGTAPFTYSWNTGDTTDTITGLFAGTYCCTLVDANLDTLIVCDTIVDLYAPLNVLGMTNTPVVCLDDSSGIAMIDTAYGGNAFAGCGLSNVNCDGPGMITQVDTDTVFNGSTTYPAPFGNWYWGAKHQFLYRASELLAAGYVGGNIDSIGFPIAAITGGATTSYPDFSVSMGCTQDTVLSNTWLTGLTTVFSDTVQISVDTIWLVFPTAYYWNGQENLVIETCFNNTGFTRNAEHRQTATAFTSSHWYRADITTVCANTTQTTGTANVRPNIVFGHCSSTANPYSSVWSNGDNGLIADSLSAGNYVVTISDINGCTAMDSIEIVNNVTVSIDDTTFCSGTSVTLDASMPEYVDYLWSNGDTVNTTVITAGNTLTVTVVDSIGCMSTDSAIVSENPSPMISLVGTSPLCNGGVDGSIDATVSSGTPSFDYLWSTADTTEDVSGVGSGSYSLTVVDSLGCSASDTIVVDDPPVLSLSVSGTDEIIGSDGEADLTVNGGTPTYTYNWDNAATTEDLTGLSAGTYEVIVTDINGCSETISVDIGSQVSVGNELANEFKVYPNPSNGLFHIQSLVDVSRITGQGAIYDVTGKKVLDVNFSGLDKVEVDLTKFERGLYLFVISVDGKQNVVQLIRH